MGKNIAHFVFIFNISSNSYENFHIATQHLEKQFNLEPPKLRLYQMTKALAAKIAPHVSSALRDLSVNFDKSILSRSPLLAGILNME